MASLKVKKVKNHEYFYWSKSVRSHKKFGGDGRTRTVDHLIGTSPLGNWLAYRLWNGDVQPQEYTEAVFKHLCPDVWKYMIKISIDWERQKVIMHSLAPVLVDCRQRRWRRERDTLQGWFEQIVSQSTWIDILVQRAAYYLAISNEDVSEAKKFREFAVDARLHPGKFKPDADLHFDELASELETGADKALEYYLEIVNNKLPIFAPPKQRSDFKTAVIRQTERLAKDRRWFEQYQTKWA